MNTKLPATNWFNRLYASLPIRMNATEGPMLQISLMPKPLPMPILTKSSLCCCVNSNMAQLLIVNPFSQMICKISPSLGKYLDGINANVLKSITNKDCFDFLYWNMFNVHTFVEDWTFYSVYNHLHSQLKSPDDRIYWVLRQYTDFSPTVQV